MDEDVSRLEETIAFADEATEIVAIWILSQELLKALDRLPAATRLQWLFLLQQRLREFVDDQTQELQSYTNESLTPPPATESSDSPDHSSDDPSGKKPAA